MKEEIQMIVIWDSHVIEVRTITRKEAGDIIREFDPNPILQDNGLQIWRTNEDEEIIFRW